MNWLENMSWTGADIAGIIAAAVAIGSAIRAGSDRREAAQSAADAKELQQQAAESQQQAAESQREAANSYKKIARSTSLETARQAHRLVLDKYGSKRIRITNPLPYTIRDLKITSTLIENRTISIPFLQPMEPEMIIIREPSKSEIDGRWDRFRLEWQTPDGQSMEQNWCISDDD